MPRKLSTGVPLSADSLHANFDVSWIKSGKIADTEDQLDLVGQERALDAIKLSADIPHSDYNLFVLGSSGYGRHNAVSTALEKRAQKQPAPADWIYVNNFEQPHKPIAIKLPPGMAVSFKRAMEELVDDLANDIPAIFEAEDYQNRRRTIEQEFGEQQEKLFGEMIKDAQEKELSVLRTPMGFAIVAMKEGRAVTPDEFKNLPESERARIDKLIAEEQKNLETILKQLPKREKEHRRQIESLNAEMAERGVDEAISQVPTEFAEVSAIRKYLQSVRADMIENAELFLSADPAMHVGAFPIATSKHYKAPQFQRYAINLMVSNSSENGEGAPIVTSVLPTLSNLVGRTEHASEMGALVTDFTMIRPGDLHKANGGYLVLDARQILMEPFAWEALKRCLKTGEITIISSSERLGLITTTSLEPDAIPLQIRVALVGERLLYYLLMAYDPDFGSLFKIAADFDDDISVSKKSSGLYARMISQIAAKHGLRPIELSGVRRILIESTRLSQDSKKLSLNLDKLSDIMREADYWAGNSGRKNIDEVDIEKAVSETERRSSRLQILGQDAINNDVLLIQSSGGTVGQINALAVNEIGGHRFGRPSRVTARVRMGKGRVVDIEREVELGGPLHSKGVLILSGYLSANYALDVPMSLWASLVFEQSYCGIDGDSASAAELFALLSALSELPIDQSFAVTGSVNQLGEIQAIGGVNEKIEGFFDVCNARGLTGKQGVLIPKANVRNLALRSRVVTAVREKKFAIIPIEKVGQGINILTNTSFGTRNAKGKFSANSVNGLVEARLRNFALKLKAFGVGGSVERSEANS